MVLIVVLLVILALFVVAIHTRNYPIKERLKPRSVFLVLSVQLTFAMLFIAIVLLVAAHYALVANHMP
jgi:hypothetical protein